MTPAYSSKRSASAVKALAPVIVLLLAACASGPVRRSTYVDETGGIRTKIESVRRELKAGLPPAKTVPAPAAASPVKTISKTPAAFEFEAEGEGYSTKYERPLDAEKRAEEDALAKAVREAGVNVYAGFLNIAEDGPGHSYEFVGKYLNIWSNALVSYQREGTPACAPAGDTYRCAVKISGTVHFTGQADPNFILKARLDKAAYFHDDSLNLLVEIEKDAYITVLHCDEDANVTLIYPNRYSRNNFLPAGKELNIPEDLAFQLKALLPPGRSETGEILHVIATRKQPLVLHETLQEERIGIYSRYSLGGLKDLAVKLSRLDRADWTARVMIYEVRKRDE